MRRRTASPQLDGLVPYCSRNAWAREGEIVSPASWTTAVTFQPCWLATSTRVLSRVTREPSVRRTTSAAPTALPARMNSVSSATPLTERWLKRIRLGLRCTTSASPPRGTMKGNKVPVYLPNCSGASAALDSGRPLSRSRHTRRLSHHRWPSSAVVQRIHYPGGLKVRNPGPQPLTKEIPTIDR